MNNDEVMAAFDALAHARKESTVATWNEAWRLVDEVHSSLFEELRQGMALLAKQGLAEDDALVLMAGLDKRERLVAKFEAFRAEAWAAYASASEELLALAALWASDDDDV